MMALPLLDLDPATKWAVILLSVLTILYAAFRSFFRKKDPLDKPPAFGSLAQQRSVERQMQNVLVEMSEMARQITAQLDTRAAKLEVADPGCRPENRRDEIAARRAQQSSPQNPPITADRGSTAGAVHG